MVSCVWACPCGVGVTVQYGCMRWRCTTPHVSPLAMTLCFSVVLADKNYEVSDEEDDLPFACYICREKFTKPVVTR